MEIIFYTPFIFLLLCGVRGLYVFGFLGLYQKWNYKSDTVDFWYRGNIIHSVNINLDASNKAIEDTLEYGEFRAKDKIKKIKRFKKRQTSNS